VAEGQECHARPRIGGVNALPMIGLGLADAVAGLLCFPLVSLLIYPCDRSTADALLPPCGGPDGERATI